MNDWKNLVHQETADFPMLCFKTFMGGGVPEVDIAGHGSRSYADKKIPNGKERGRLVSVWEDK